ncbi:MAG: hypothetical protein V3U35_03545 [Candidatus Neomarinimicrobiota bacterium]
MQATAAFEPTRHRFTKVIQASLFAGLLLAPPLAGQEPPPPEVSGQVPAGQEQPETPESATQRVYRQAYEAALADSVISPEEEAVLKALQEALGLHEDVVDEALGAAVRPLAPGLNRSGRWTLVAQNMGWGVGLYGWGIPYVLGAEDFKWILAGEMFSLGASLYLTWKYTADMDLPEARSQMQRFGGVVGLHYAIAVTQLSEATEQEKLGVAIWMAAVPAGVWAGDRLYQRWRLSTGQAYALALHVDLGRSIMSLLHQQLHVPEPERPQEFDYETYNPQSRRYTFDDAAYERDYDAYEREMVPWQKINTLFQVAGYPVGTYLSRRFYGTRPYSFGDAVMLTVGRGTGAFYGLILADLLGSDFSEDAMGWRWLIGAGAVGGVVGMDRAIRGVDYSFGQSALMFLGEIAGVAFGVGVGVLMEIEPASDYYKIAVIGGTLGGLALARRMIEPVPERSNRLGARPEPSVRVALQPLPVGGSLLPGLGVEVRW